jgi:hypothetical protein
MVICLDESRIRTVAQVRAMLKGTYPLEFTAATDAASHCGWIAVVLGRLHYRSLSREDGGVVLQSLRHFSGFSRAAPRTPRGAPSNAFAKRYTPADLDALADVERKHGRLFEPAKVAVLRSIHPSHRAHQDPPRSPCRLSEDGPTINK